MKFLLTTLLIFLSPYLANVSAWSNYSPVKNSRFFLRVFKHEKKLELWVLNNSHYKFYKEYSICALSGTVGPKRKYGDLQVPEGFYYINRFNPKSKYKYSLGLNYPNESDRILGFKGNLGGSIFIHGSCLSVGCIAIGDLNIGELYQILSEEKTITQVHVFPIDYSNRKSVYYLENLMKKRSELIDFEKNIYEGYSYFEDKLILPKISVSPQGKYIFQ